MTPESNNRLLSLPHKHSVDQTNDKATKDNDNLDHLFDLDDKDITKAYSTSTRLIRHMGYSPLETKPSKAFMNREFSFTLLGDTYIRFQSFKTLDEFKQELTRLRPVKIDLGAIYNIRPRDKNSVRASFFTPISKELVFDIDMTDYDDIRTCCSGGDVCVKCWEFMTVAMKIIHAALTGRRGIHCWIADERARQLNNEQRKAIVSYLEVVKGGAQQGKKVKLPNILHPSLSRSLDIIHQHFPNIAFETQDIFVAPENWAKVLEAIPDDAIRERIRGQWDDAPTRSPSQKWRDLLDIIGEAIAETPKRKLALESIPRDIMFQYTYPRLDEKVSTNINHLLKSPFCVHPKTGRVCVPIAIETCEEFDPKSPPTVPDLIKELNEYDAKNPSTSGRGKLQDWQKTSLRKYVEIFEQFVDGIINDIRGEKRAENSRSLDF
ncbi:hypothetical protein BGW38_006943 [Lunasporangiospora selenospora]|uniref:DNA primase n=1 Tax=Lunasporangiospora selenospora TaxID=979761 RepID=A0A9P6G3R3_9FUNG|nr:hypothetical protein BGW38_006943 [Lunasporangiospora selenospora]